MALFRTMYRIVQRYAPLTNLEGDADLIPLTGGTIIPSYHSRPVGKDILRFITELFRAAQGNTVKTCEFFAQRCAALLDHSVEACVAELDRTANWESCEWKQLNTALVLHPGSNTRFYGVPLHNPEGRAEFESQGANFLAKAHTELQTRFSNTHPVAKATSFLDFFR